MCSGSLYLNKNKNKTKQDVTSARTFVAAVVRRHEITGLAKTKPPIWVRFVSFIIVVDTYYIYKRVCIYFAVYVCLHRKRGNWTYAQRTVIRVSPDNDCRRGGSQALKRLNNNFPDVFFSATRRLRAALNVTAHWRSGTRAPRAFHVRGNNYLPLSA